MTYFDAKIITVLHLNAVPRGFEAECAAEYGRTTCRWRKRHPGRPAERHTLSASAGAQQPARRANRRVATAESEKSECRIDPSRLHAALDVERKLPTLEQILGLIDWLDRKRAAATAALRPSTRSESRDFQHLPIMHSATMSLKTDGSAAVLIFADHSVRIGFGDVGSKFGHAS